MRKIIAFVVCVLVLRAGSLWAAAPADDEVYGEDAIKAYKDKLPDEPKWKEQGLVMPPYPQDDKLIEVDIDRHDYPYRVFVDSGSLSVGEDRVVRYTVVLRSKSGVDNVSFEGLRCTSHQYKRYAYGSAGKFHAVPRADWKYLRHDRQDIYRNVLANNYLCPVPTGDPVPQLVTKLKGTIDRFIFQGDLE